MTDLVPGSPASTARTVIVGTSLAGITAARELRKRGYTGSLDMVDADVLAPYRRPEVSKGMLSGKFDETTVRQRVPAELDTCRHHAVAEHLDLGAGEVHLRGADGAYRLPFDRLVLATGAGPRAVPPEWLGEAGAAGPPANVYLLRAVGDALALRRALARARRLVVVGAGFIGLEAAAVARRMGLDVTVLEAAARPLGRVLGADFGAHIAALHEREGVQMRTGASVAAIECRAGRAGGVRLSDGELIDADVVLVAIGSQPSTGWLAGSGIAIDDGVMCDHTCAVAGGGCVVAAGDVANWFNPLYGRRMRVEHWTNAIEQGVYAAQRLLGAHDAAGFVTVPYFWSDQYETKVQSVGSTIGATQTVTVCSAPYFVAYEAGGAIVAAVGIDVGAKIFKARTMIAARTPFTAAVAELAAMMATAR